jgi:DNA-binding MarR family transcriptional regulator
MQVAAPTSTISKRYEISGLVMEKTIKLMRLSFSRILLLHPEIDVTIDQWIIIQLLYKHSQLNQQELSELAFKDAPTVTRMIDLLVTKGIVIREADTNDRRKFIISLTASGSDTYHKVLPLLLEFRTEAYEGITTEELKTLEKIMNKIFENLSNQN